MAYLNFFTCSFVEILDKLFEERKSNGGGGYLGEDNNTAFEEERAQREEEERKRRSRPVAQIAPISEVVDSDGSDQDVFA